VDVKTQPDFNDVTLEQADEQGRSVWKVKAEEATYSKDRKLLKFRSQPVNYSRWQTVYQIIAQQENPAGWQQLFLQVRWQQQIPGMTRCCGNVELQVEPQEDLLIVRNQVTELIGRVKAVAQAVRSEFSNQIAGTGVGKATDPALQLQTELLIWQIRAKLIGVAWSKLTATKVNHYRPRHGKFLTRSTKPRSPRSDRNAPVDCLNRR